MVYRTRMKPKPEERVHATETVMRARGRGISLHCVPNLYDDDEDRWALCGMPGADLETSGREITRIAPHVARVSCPDCLGTLQVARRLAAKIPGVDVIDVLRALFPPDLQADARERRKTENQKERK